MIYERGNLRFKSRAMRPLNPDNDRWLIDVERISDGHRLHGQMWFDADPTEATMVEAADYWIAEHPGADHEPDQVVCVACGRHLESEFDTDYGFDNALWIGFHGGYGMFVDTMARWPINADGSQWLHDEDGAIVVDDNGLVKDPAWVPQYEEARVLPGRPDLEAVICHECAHALCEAVPWIGKLIDPRHSHAHHAADYPRLLAEGHQGWDLDRDAGGDT